MATYDYQCPDGHVTESRQGYGVTSIPCQCGAEATRQSVYAPHQIGLAAVPLNQRHYGKQLALVREASEERSYAYAKVERELGHPVPSPDLWAIAKRRAGI